MRTRPMNLIPAFENKKMLLNVEGNDGKEEERRGKEDERVRKWNW